MRNHPSPAHVAFLAVVSISAWSSCRQVVGVQQRELDLAPCDPCLGLRCSAETQACLASKPCSARLDCLDGCTPGDAPCRSRCDIDRATPEYHELAALRACQAANCSADCHAGCADLPVVAPATVADSCRSCLETRCCDLADACRTEEACLGIDECIRSQATPDEAQACLTAGTAEAASSHRKLESCLDLYCNQDCGLGAFWPCLGQVSWPTASSETIQVRLRAVTNGGLAPIPDLAVKACLLTDLNCTTPVDSGSTGQDGFVTLEVKTLTMSGLVGFTGFVEITDPAGILLPTLVFSNPPITRSDTVHDVVIGDQRMIEVVEQSSQVALRSDRGHVVLSIRDCANRPGAGVSLVPSTKDEFTAVRYAALFDVSPTATATDRYGTAFVLNAVPGGLTITGTLEATGETVGKVGVQTRSGWITEVLLSPSP